MELLLATANPGKAREFAGLLGECRADLRLVTLSDLHIHAGVAEDGRTFRDNARIKALHYSRLAGGRLTVADDSGLVVAALGGAPGVHSARFAGSSCRDEDNVAKLLRLLEGASDRRARFVICLHLARGGESVAEFSGHVAGTILDRPVGRHGFGYDPVFFYPPLASSFAQLDAAAKNRVSHRARAAARLCDFLRRLPA